jgi:2-dehydropantoate 2-reductase
MKYLIVGAGAMGSTLGGYMTLAGKDTTVIARGESLRVLQADGLTLHTPTTGSSHEAPMATHVPRGETLTIPLHAVAEEDYADQPDVVIVTVKAYSLQSIVPLLNRVCGRGTIVLPLQNSIGIAERIARALDADARVIEGVSYVACELLAPGEARHKLDFFRIVLGARSGTAPVEELQQIAQDLRDSGGVVELSDNMLKSELEKFVRIASLSGTLAYFGGTLGDVVANPERSEMHRTLATEITEIAAAAGCPLAPGIVEETVQMMRETYPGYRSSLKADLDAGKPTEIEDQIFNVVELGKSYGLEMPVHRTVAEKFGYEG